MGRAAIVVGPPNYDDETRKELAQELCALIFRTSVSFEHLGPLVICSVSSPLKIECQLKLQEGSFGSTVELQASVSFLDLPFRGEVTKAIQKKYNWDQLPQQIQDGFKKSGGTTAFFSIAKPDEDGENSEE